MVWVGIFDVFHVRPTCDFVFSSIPLVLFDIPGIFMCLNTPWPLYNTVRYNTVLYIARFKDGSQKCMVIFQYILYIFVWI